MWTWIPSTITTTKLADLTSVKRATFSVDELASYKLTPL